MRAEPRRPGSRFRAHPRGRPAPPTPARAGPNERSLAETPRARRASRRARFRAPGLPPAASGRAGLRADPELDGAERLNYDCGNWQRSRHTDNLKSGVILMTWEAPSFVEVKMDAEINSYQDDFEREQDDRF